MKTIDLSLIFNKQKELDQYIQNHHQVTYELVFNKLRLALAVELGELANEVRCFKFWSYKERSKKEVVIEEYVDGIHFITSLCIAKKIEPIIKVPSVSLTNDKDELTQLFNDLFGSLYKLSSAREIKIWYGKYLALGEALGFSLQEIVSAYIDKNNVNHQRQDSHY